MFINCPLTSGGGNIIRQMIPATTTPKLKATTTPRRKISKQLIPRPSFVESNNAEAIKITMTSQITDILIVCSTPGSI